jgi:hypothetical protein
MAQLNEVSLTPKGDILARNICNCVKEITLANPRVLIKKISKKNIGLHCVHLGQHF